ncbi:YcjF family protein [Lyngbya confervoides]|uniref:50S ribosome-binding GTPase n=1 Tax=Lyngbya confervoides BDU141951 TaxID=1574623 RepID=A0ABD4T5I5_9CYAN|nr:GTPase [Lyngbya confervoides]MCM1983810.1 50S ribosome-binding GTPase [Lyngbya confervoides BDU141951]
MKPWAKFRRFSPQRLGEYLPIQALHIIPEALRQWFQVDEARIAEILAQVRAQIPTTEVLLLGKPQSGKSSVIRALTGATPEIIGQGFRPHTTHTQTYTYPTRDLPLLVFTDTVGLGDGQEDPEKMVEELMMRVSPQTADRQACAKIILITVKVNDFATDYLLKLLRSIRAQHRAIPTLLVATCLHELYPPSQSDHPPYPPLHPEIERAVATLQAQFQGQADRFVLVDFTLEADGFTPTFYGLEAFVEALSALLPEAESRLIHQLLDQAEAGNAIESVYREAGRRYILPFSIAAATLAAVPLPLATMPVLTSLQVSLVALLGRLYGQPLSPSQAGGVISAIAGGFVAQAIGRELIKFVPGVGSVIAASWAGAYTWALGEGACVYFGDLMGGHRPDPQKIQNTMQEAFRAAQARFRNSASET